MVLRTSYLLLICVCCIAGTLSWASSTQTVTLVTSLGEIEIALHTDDSPKTVDNFLGYVRTGSYDGTIFHRVIPDFMIQGGGYTTGLKKVTTYPPIQNESNNGLANIRGTISMARKANPHTATSQFFINTVDNNHLDYKNFDEAIWGYAVFGSVVSGMDVIDVIESVETTRIYEHNDIPKTPVVIEKIKISSNME